MLVLLYGFLLYTLHTGQCRTQDGEGVVGKGIYQKSRFFLDIFRLFRFRDFMSNCH